MPGIGIGIGIGLSRRLPEPGVGFDMLENGLDFITEAVEAINASSNHRKLKYAVIHLSSGVELIFKEVLRTVDWRLIFQEIKDAKPEILKSGDFRTINFFVAMERLKTYCKIEFTEEDRQILEDLRLKRNRIEHFKFDEKVRLLRTLTARVLIFLIQFIESNIIKDSVSNLSKKYIKNLPNELAKFSMYVSMHDQRVKKSSVKKLA